MTVRGRDDGWDVDAEFGENPTRVDPSASRLAWDTAESNVIISIEDAPTAPRCGCGSQIVDLGPIMPDALTLAATHPMACARGAGNTGWWTWCVAGPEGWEYHAHVRRG